MAHRLQRLIAFSALLLAAAGGWAEEFITLSSTTSTTSTDQSSLSGHLQPQFEAKTGIKFVAKGSRIDRREVMYNDFIVVGPKSDAAIKNGGEQLFFPEALK